MENENLKNIDSANNESQNDLPFVVDDSYDQGGDFKISTTSDPSVTSFFQEETGGLDDSRLTDDFVIGQDFFIDSSAADEIATEENFKKAKKKGRKRKKKSSAGKGCLFAVVWMAAILVISIAAASVILFLGKDYLGVNLDPDSAEDNIEIVIAEGASAKEIAELLEKGVISSQLFFRYYASQGGYAPKFRDGIYYFSKQDSYEDIIDKLTKMGEQAESVKVTIPEGWTIDKIAARLEENKVCTAEQFKKAVNEATYEKYPYDFIKGLKTESEGVHYRLEGYLFPDTYYFYQTNNKAGAEQAIKKMLQNFDNKISPSMRIHAENMGVPLHDIITMASIIEMESSVAKLDVKKQVSAVFWNRINDWGAGAHLQSDPTTNYKYNPERYDTYKIVGLAPGAYCSPSLDSINAALYPDEESKNYFFVTDKDMKFYFTKTNEEHNQVIRDLKNKGLWVS